MVEQIKGDKGGLPPELVKEFNSLPNDTKTTIALTKRDIELLINSLAALHQSYAAMIDTPFIVIGGKEHGDIAETNAAKSYELFQELAESLMSRFIDKEREDG